MPAPEPANDPAHRQRFTAFLVAALFALGWHLWVGDAHLNPAEEGYLWYGTWRTALGELPLRDFQSYDPGRYFTCAALGRLFGDGLMGLRRSEACVQGLGLFFGLLAARRATRRAWPLWVVGLVLGLWLFPRHKVFEGALGLIATWAATRLLERPTRSAHLLAGLVAGLAAFFGRNHGLYAALGFTVLCALSALRRRDADWFRKAAALCVGVVLGYAPMLALFLGAEGFFQSFVDSLLLLLRLGTNIESPWLFPWRVELAQASPAEVAARLALAAVYLLPFAVLPLGFVALLWTRAEDLPRRALFLAATVMGALYLHHASVRSDTSHLAQSIQPTLLAAVALVALLAERRRGLAGLALLALPVGYAGFEHNPATNHVGRAALVEVDLAGDRLRMLPQQADYYRRLQRGLAARLASDDQLFIAPARPAFYPLCGRPTPVWWIYFFVPDAPPEEEAEIVSGLADVEWVLLVDTAIAEREELRFQKAYPNVWAHVLAAYERVPTPEWEANHQLYRRRP